MPDRIKSDDDDTCICGEPLAKCGDAHCAVCANVFPRCEMRRSLCLVLANRLVVDDAMFCADCWKDEDPDAC